MDLDLAALADLKQPATFDVQGKHALALPPGWTVKTPDGLERKRQTVPSMSFNTLTGLKDYLAHNVDELEVAKLMLHVTTESHVGLVSRLAAQYDAGIFSRDYFAAARVEPVLPKDMWGYYMPSELAIIRLQTLFEPTPDRERLLQLLAGVSDNMVRQANDDGLAQEVVVRRGVTSAKRELVPNPNRLKPYRTFLEVEQPESPFLIRLRPCDGEPPEVALFECDGGRWKIEAAARVQAWLRANIEGVAVLQ
ncbi:MAG TPA: hypothetical protein VIV56_07190 [Gemmatimonadales bacterium]